MSWFDVLTEEEREEIIYKLEGVYNIVNSSDAMTDEAYDDFVNSRLYKGIDDFMQDIGMWG